jgi:uncharacterized protein YbaR (Trm112 family)
MQTAIDPLLLEILVCPETRANVALGSAALVKQVNAAIEKRALVVKGGEPVTEKVDALLVRQDNEVAYAVRDGIPIMLIGQQIPLGQLTQRPPARRR